MLKQCQDSYSVQFTQFPALLAYHEETRKASLWERSEVKSLRVAALDAKSPLYEDKSGFDPSVSQEAIADTAENLGLAIQVGGRYFPLRDTAGPRSTAPPCPSSQGRSWPKCSTPAWNCTKTAPFC